MLKKIQILMAVLTVTCLAGCGNGVNAANISAAVQAQETESQVTKEETNSAETEHAELKTTEENTADTGDTNEVRIPEIRVTYGSPVREIPSQSGSYTLVKEVESKNSNLGPMKQVTNACADDPLHVLVEENAEIPYLELGAVMKVQFRNGSTPDSVEIKDMILDESGNRKYGESSVVTLTPELGADGLEIVLDTNMAAMLSSDMSTYEKGGVLRGFRMTCMWENESDAEYAWIIRTDAWDGTESVDENQENTAEIPVSFTVQSVDETKRGQSILAELNNESEEIYMYGAEYVLKKTGEETEIIPMLEGIGWEDVEYQLDGNQRNVIELLVEECFGRLEPGDYVIEKDLHNAESGEMFTVTAKFRITE